jgi:hypothetical protein
VSFLFYLTKLVHGYQSKLIYCKIPGVALYI